MKKTITLLLIISFILSSTVAYADVTIYGRGSAHGVGLSMAGTNGMALAGYKYNNIINYYYPNTVWNTRDDNTVILAKCQKAGHSEWVNITVKEYLYRLAEEPDSWPKEGLKAAMVAARTYLWYKIETKGKFESGQYWLNEINPATRPNIVAAVNETANQVLTYNNRAIVAAYSGSAGGYTAKMSDVWGGSDIPYPYLVNKESPYDSSSPSGYQWSKNLTPAAIQTAYPTIGVFNSLSITERTSADEARSRVKKIQIIGSNGSITDTGWNFKSKVGLKSNFFWLKTWPALTSPTPPTPKPKAVITLQTGARKAVFKRMKKGKFWFRVVDSQNKNVKVYLIIKKGKKRIAKIYAGIKATNKLAHKAVIFRNAKPGNYRYYVVAYNDQNQQTKTPGNNLLVLKR